MKFYQEITFTLSPFKKQFIFLLLIFLTNIVFAQTSQNNTNNQLPKNVRIITGSVKDSTNVGVPYATVKLVSVSDTIRTGTNADGFFVLNDVKEPIYSLEIRSLGYKPYVGNFIQNDTISKIVMKPIILKIDANTLNEVVVNGTPAITYKTDTVQYRASEYKVKENANVDELLEKMEGMEVGPDGSLVFQGTVVTKVKINGKIYLGGDIASAIKNLPAEIVDKIQMVDDYGDQSERTGVKVGEPEKIINIVTRVDKSVGNRLNLRGGVGNNERYEGSLFATRINENQTIGVNARLNNTVNGVAGDDNNRGRGGNSSSGGSGGTTQNGSTSFSYRDQLSKVVNINTSYRYNFNNTNSNNSSVSQIFSSLGTTIANRESSVNSNSKSHDFKFEFEADLDSNNFLKIEPNLSFSNSISANQSSLMQTGLIHQDQTGKNTSTNSRPNLEATVFYQHIFKKPRRNFSIQFRLNNRNQESEQERNSNILYYQDESDIILKDSLINRLVERDNITRNYRVRATFAEPLSENTQLELNGQINYNGYDNTATTSNIFANGNRFLVDSLSNIYDYSFTQSRLSLNYRYGLVRDSKIKFSLGLTAEPTVLTGTKVSLGTTTRRTNFNLIPIARFQYLWSRQHNIQLNYSGDSREPSFDQIQPVTDVSNPQNPVVGNPDLLVAFNHSINTRYNNYITKSKLNYSIDAYATFTENAIVRNTVQIRDAYNSLKNETRYTNVGGVYRINGGYSISKQLSDRKYNLSYNGNVSHNHGVSLSNNVKNITSTWSFRQRFGPRINPTEWLEVNPSISYSFTKSNNSLPTSIDSRTNNLSLGIDGEFTMWKSLIFGYRASKNYVSGINTNLNNNPFIINSYLEKELWKRKAIIKLQVFDLLNQNNFINRDITDESITDTKSNALSRYFMLSFRVRLQKWSGPKSQNNKESRRRSDGSFN